MSLEDFAEVDNIEVTESSLYMKLKERREASYLKFSLQSIAEKSLFFSIVISETDFLISE